MPQEPEGHVIRDTVRYDYSPSLQEQRPLSVKAQEDEPGAIHPAPQPQQTGRNAVQLNRESSPAPPQLSEAARRSASGQQAQRDDGPSYKHQVRDVSIPSSTVEGLVVVPEDYHCVDVDAPPSSIVSVAAAPHDECQADQQRHRLGASGAERFVHTSSATAGEEENRRRRATSTHTLASSSNGTVHTRGSARPIAIAHAKLLPNDDIENQDTTEPAESTQQENSHTKLTEQVSLGTVLALFVFDKDENVYLTPVGEDHLQGTELNLYLGTALALSQTGHRMAVASPGMVRIYELGPNGDENNKRAIWQQLGSDIIFNDESGASKVLELQDPGMVSIALDRAGKALVVGHGLAGLAKVYSYKSLEDEWAQIGQTLNGGNPLLGDRFGASVAVNADGKVIAVGAPSEGGPGSIYIYQSDSDGTWGQLGQPIRGDNTTASVSELGRSVSLSASGDRVAGGARSAPSIASASDFLNVACVYEYERHGDLNWKRLGNGISGVSPTKTTGWYVDLDAAGNRMAVSNTYLRREDFVNTNPDALIVQAFEFVNGSWQKFGGRLHQGITGQKSGYVVSYTDDGLTISMGDRGTNEGGSRRGHAHIYKHTSDGWIQHGPTIEGDADGDSFGFSVAIAGDGSRIAAGAPYNRAATNDGGQVKAFDVEYL